MVYRKRTGRVVKKIVKKSYKKSGKRLSKRSSLVSLIKKISLKKCETKHTHYIAENINLNHNTPNLDGNHLNTSQSIADNNSGTSNFACRIGDEVIARGISYKFWFANKLDRPNVMYKIVIFRYKASNATPSSPAPYCSQGSTNFMIRDLDMEAYKVIRVITFNLQTNAQKIQTIGSTLLGAEGHKYISVYIPLKDARIKYNDGTSIPRFTDIGYNVVAYDSYGTATTDNIASFAVNRKFYFKDP